MEKEILNRLDKLTQNETYNDCTENYKRQFCLNNLKYKKVEKLLKKSAKSISLGYFYFLSKYDKMHSKNNNYVTNKYKNIIQNDSETDDVSYEMILICLYVDRYNELLKSPLNSDLRKEFNILLSTILKYENFYRVIDVYIDAIDKMNSLISNATTEEQRKKLYKDMTEKRIKLETEYISDDLNELSLGVLKSRFMEAIQTDRIKSAYKLLGKIGDQLDSGEENYFEALINLKENDLDECIRYAKKVDKKDLDYKNTIDLLLESYSLKGDADNFFRVLNDNKKYTYNLSLIITHINYLIFNANEENYEKIIKNDFKYIYDEMENIKTTTEEDENSRELIECQKFLDNLLVDAFNIYEEYTFTKNVYNNTKIDIEDERKLERIKSILKFNNIYEYVEDIFNEELYLEENIENGRDTLSLFILGGSVDEKDNCIEVVYSKYTKLLKDLKLLYKLKNYKLLVKIIDDNYNNIPKSKEYNEILTLAYKEAITYNMEITNFKKFENELNTTEIENDLEKNRVINTLTDEGKLVFKAIEKIFKETDKEEYKYMDSGLLSFGYFRIVEHELNARLINRVVEEIDINEFEEIYRNSSKKVIKNWQIIFKKIIELKSGKDKESFMLGNLAWIMEGILKDNQVASYLQSIFLEFFTEYGIDKLKNGYFTEILNKSIRDKYRNPPAHTKYLPYYVACECKEEVLGILKEFDKIIKK